MKYDKSWYNNLNKSSLSPPSWVFSVVWPILYTIMTISLYFVWSNKKCYPFCKPIYFFIIQLIFNLIWTTLFFKMKKPLLAFIDICFIIVFTFITIKEFYKIDKISSYLLVPYLLWLLFASYLNGYILLNN